MKFNHWIYPLLMILVWGPVGQNALAGDNLSVVAVGDVMMGSTGQRGVLPPENGRDLFENVSQYLNDGDIIFGNLEGPLLDEGESIKCPGERMRYCFEFKTPSRYGLYLKQAGFTVLNIANNHTWDFGVEGVKSTLETLGTLGLAPLGGKAIVELNMKGKKIALVGFSYLSSTYSFSILEIEKAKEIVAKLKESHDLVIVSFHGGAEGKSALLVINENEIFLDENRGNVILFSRAVVDAGADLVLGHGPHVLRALEVYKGKLIAYSLGNFLTFGMFNLKGPNGVSVILKVKLDPETGRFLEGRLIPVKLINGGIPEFDETRQGIELLKQLTHKGGYDFNVRISEEGKVSFIQ
jgi:poly-gamma-glutamate capsule biosynthesis protein CapA/YwtB (metallophosphatase superfamily)